MRSSSFCIVCLCAAWASLAGDGCAAPTYGFTAKLAVTARPIGSTSHGPDWYEQYLQDFYGTIIEVLESSEMRSRAMVRVHALHPQLKETAVEVKVRKHQQSGIFSVQAFGEDPKYAHIFLDALLDEFIAFRDQIREQQRNKALTTLAEDVVSREKNLKETASKLSQFESSVISALLEAEQQRLIRRIMALRDSRDDLTLPSETAGQQPGNADKLASTKAALERLERDLKEVSSKIAEGAALKAQVEQSKQAFEGMLGLVRRTTVSEDMATEGVVIMQRALNDVGDAR